MDLVEAAAKGDTEMVRKAVSKNPYGSKGNDQAMQKAVQYGQTEALQELLNVSLNDSMIGNDRNHDDENIENRYK